MPVGEYDEYMTVQELIDELKKRNPNEPALYDRAYEKMCFFYHENTREWDGDPDTCQMILDQRLFGDKDFDCEECSEKTMCQITLDAKNIIKKMSEMKQKVKKT